MSIDKFGRRLGKVKKDLPSEDIDKKIRIIAGESLRIGGRPNQKRKFDAIGLGIRNLHDPEEDQDAITLKYLNENTLKKVKLESESENGDDPQSANSSVFSAEHSRIQDVASPKNEGDVVTLEYFNKYVRENTIRKVKWRPESIVLEPDGDEDWDSIFSAGHARIEGVAPPKNEWDAVPLEYLKENYLRPNQIQPYLHTLEHLNSNALVKSKEYNVVDVGDRRLIRIADPLDDYDGLTLGFLKKCIPAEFKKEKNLRGRDETTRSRWTFGNQLVCNVGSPEQDTDAANKVYVDAIKTKVKFLEENALQQSNAAPHWDAAKKRIMDVGIPLADGDAISVGALKKILTTVFYDLFGMDGYNLDFRILEINIRSIFSKIYTKPELISNLVDKAVKPNS